MIVNNSLGPDLPATEAELFQIDHYSLFDEKEGLGIIGKLEILKGLLQILVEQTIPEVLVRLEKAYAKGEWNKIRKLAHQLKGSSLYCGTIRMRYACQYMERYILAGHYKVRDELYQQLIKTLHATLECRKCYDAEVV